jgi:hypothetical protein
VIERGAQQAVVGGIELQAEVPAQNQSGIRLISRSSTAAS